MLTSLQTVVSSQCYTTQRDPEVFPNPDAFLPDRWIDIKNYRSDTKILFMPFSSGPRACLGKSLAMIELSLITATLVRSFQVKPSPATTADSMSMKDHFLVLPKGGACDLVFERRDYWVSYLKTSWNRHTKYQESMLTAQIFDYWSPSSVSSTNAMRDLP